MQNNSIFRFVLSLDWSFWVVPRDSSPSLDSACRSRENHVRAEPLVIGCRQASAVRFGCQEPEGLLLPPKIMRLRFVSVLTLGCCFCRWQTMRVFSFWGRHPACAWDSIMYTYWKNELGIREGISYPRVVMDAMAESGSGIKQAPYSMAVQNWKGRGLKHSRYGNMYSHFALRLCDKKYVSNRWDAGIEGFWAMMKFRFRFPRLWKTSIFLFCYFL